MGNNTLTFNSSDFDIVVAATMPNLFYGDNSDFSAFATNDGRARAPKVGFTISDAISGYENATGQFLLLEKSENVAAISIKVEQELVSQTYFIDNINRKIINREIIKIDTN